MIKQLFGHVNEDTAWPRRFIEAIPVGVEIDESDLSYAWSDDELITYLHSLS